MVSAWSGRIRPNRKQGRGMAGHAGNVEGQEMNMEENTTEKAKFVDEYGCIGYLQEGRYNVLYRRSGIT